MLNKIKIPQWCSNKDIILVLLLTLGLLFVCPPQAYAMHLAEGILPWKWCTVWFVVAAAPLATGIVMIRRKRQEVRGLMPFLGLVGAFIFVVSMFPIPVPVTGSCSHPCGTPLGAILVGPFISTVLGALALLIQALFLAHGGISTWGANIVSMAFVGSFTGLGAFILLRKFNAPLFAAAFVAGFVGDLATYATTSFELASALHGTHSMWGMFSAVFAAFCPTQLPLAVLEGLFTGGLTVLIYQRRPELLSQIRPKWFQTASSKVKGGA